MSGRPLRVRAIALVAAYAVALQGLLSAFIPVAVALPAGVLCSGKTIGEPAAPTNHETDCSLACATLAASVPPPPDTVVARHVLRSVDDVVVSPAPSVAAPRGLQTARAPPFV